MRILNLYAGLGGNRKLWGDEHEVTAVEIDPHIARVYKKLFPNDKVIVGDAHEFLLKNYMNYDFIWSSPPCPTHSDIRRCGVHKGQYEALYPDMNLYQEIILLKHFGKCPWVVENVVSYYDYLITPYIAGRHCFWSNFVIPKDKIDDERLHSDIVGSEEVYGFTIKSEDVEDKRKLLRNLVNPKIGLYIFNLAFKEKQSTLKLDY